MRLEKLGGAVLFLLVWPGLVDAQNIEPEQDAHPSQPDVKVVLPEGLSEIVTPPEIDLNAKNPEDAFPQYYTLQIENDEKRKYRRLLIQLGKDKQLQAELEITIPQKQNWKNLIRRSILFSINWRKRDSSSMPNIRKTRRMKKFEKSLSTRLGSARGFKMKHTISTK